MGINKDNLMDGIFGKSSDIETISHKDNEIKNIPIELIDDLCSFEHPYDKSLNMGLGIAELSEQIKAVGLQQPIVVRPKDGGRYEVLIGHRRKRASILAGLTTIKAIIKECNDDEAKLISTDNLGQRPLTFPSEIAKAYKIQIEGYKNQGKRNDLVKEVQDDNFGQLLPEVEESGNSNLRQPLPEVNARNIVGQRNNVAPRTVSNYLRLNELIPTLLDMVDSKEIPFMAGVHVSHLKNQEQSYLEEILTSDKKLKISESVAKLLRELSKKRELDKESIEAVFFPNKAEIKEKSPRAVYKDVFQAVEKQFKNLPEEKAVKLAMCDKDKLEKIISDAVNGYLDMLQ